jgi:hypothetical protein
MTTRTLAAVLVAGIGTVLVLFAVLLGDQGTDGRHELWIEVGKALLQVAVVAVAGTVLKLLADSYQARRQRLEAREAFRRQKYGELVAITSRLRSVPAYVRADPSAATLTAQLRAVLEVDAGLRQIKHEIDSSGQSDVAALIDSLVQMIRYTSWVAEDIEKVLREERTAPTLESDAVTDMIKDAEQELSKPGPRSFNAYYEQEGTAMKRMLAPQPRAPSAMRSNIARVALGERPR